MKNKTKLVPPVHKHIEPIVITLKNDSDEEWIRGYNEYCEKTGKRMSISPHYQLRDDGTFSTVVLTGVSELK